MKTAKSNKDRRVAFYLDQQTLARIEAKQQELHRQGLGVSLSRVLSMLVLQGLQQPKVRT